MKKINWAEFEAVELCVGTILDVSDFPEAKKPAYKLTVDFGPLGVKKSSAQITKNYSKQQLLGKQVVGVVNFEPKQIGKFMSEFLVTGFADEHGDIVLTSVDAKLPNGSRMI